MTGVGGRKVDVCISPASVWNHQFGSKIHVKQSIGIDSARVLQWYISPASSFYITNVQSGVSIYFGVPLVFDQAYWNHHHVTIHSTRRCVTIDRHGPQCYRWTLSRSQPDFNCTGGGSYASRLHHLLHHPLHLPLLRSPPHPPHPPPRLALPRHRHPCHPTATQNN